MAQLTFTFPYSQKNIDEGKLVDPRVVIEIKTKYGFWPFKFLVDSGADVTSLPLIPHAELFDFRKQSHEKTTIGGIEGRSVGAYPFTLDCRISVVTFRIRCYFIESRIDPLLGRLDFWKHYSVHFDNSKNQTVFSPVK